MFCIIITINRTVSVFINQLTLVVQCLCCVTVTEFFLTLDKGSLQSVMQGGKSPNMESFFLKTAVELRKML